MRESEIEDALVARIKALGGECRKVKWIGRNGAPDQLVMLPSKHRVIGGHGTGALTGYFTTQQTVWVELKAPGQKPWPNQVREHERMHNLGQIVLVIDSIELIDKHFPLN